jgi:hypothetical protein
LRTAFAVHATEPAHTTAREWSAVKARSGCHTEVIVAQLMEMIEMMEVMEAIDKEKARAHND